MRTCPKNWILNDVSIATGKAPIDPSTHIDSDIVTGELPGVEVKPVIGHLDLVPINDLLLEDTVTVSQTIAPGGEVERGKTVKEAGGKTTETAIA